MAISSSEGSGCALCVYRYSGYPSPGLTDLLVGFLQANASQFNCEVFVAAVSGSDAVLSAFTPFLLFNGPRKNKCLKSASQQTLNNISRSSSASCYSSNTQQFVPLCGGVGLSDWAAAKCIVNQLTAAGASTGFLLGVHVEPRVFENKETMPQRKGNSPILLRYTVKAAVDVCESWWAVAQAEAVEEAKANNADAQEEGYATYFAELLGSLAAGGGFLPFLFDTPHPTLADMGLHALLRRFPSAATLLQIVLSRRAAAALPPIATAGATAATGAAASSSKEKGSSSPAPRPFDAAAGRLSAWMERVAAATMLLQLTPCCVPQAAPLRGAVGKGGGAKGPAAPAGGKTAGGRCGGGAAATACEGKNLMLNGVSDTERATAGRAEGGRGGADDAAGAAGAEGADGAAASGAAAGGGDGPDATGTVNFLKQIVENDLQTGKHKTVITRFPPEPNGFLHLGHAKSIRVNFGLATAFNGRCHLRFDDTNPMKEEMRYIESIQRDVRWLGGDWGSHLYYASDYFQQLYDWAEDLIKKGLAFVDDDDQETIRRKRGSITQPGENSGYRNRTVEENLDLFRRMKAGEFEEGARVLRAKIDMTHSNMNMRDPILYRILKKHHPRTGDTWVIYPTYDYAHGQSDSLEKITHSICTLEFELHRPLYDWFQEKLEIYPTRQIEFARLNVTHTVMSKRKLLALVVEKWVAGWDDPRLPTLSGLRRRGAPAAALLTFCDRVGVARRESVIQVELLERCIREALHPIAPRRFALQQPLRVTLINFPDGREEVVTASNHPQNPAFGSRKLHFTKNIFIDHDDFMETPLPGYQRLVPGGEVRLKHAYWIKCQEVVKDATGCVTELRCTYDPHTMNCSLAPEGARRVKKTIQWLSDKDAAPAELRIYSRMFNKANPEEAEEGKPEASWRDCINPDSLKIYKGLVERCVTDKQLFPPQSSVQFERLGFFTPDASTLPEDQQTEEEESRGGEATEGETKKGETREKGLVAIGRGARLAGEAGGGEAGLPVFNLTVSLQESFTTGEDGEKEKAKAQDKLAREKAALERQKKKEERELKKSMKEKQQLQKTSSDAAVCKREPTVCS